MNSFNHYAYGSVGEWMYANIAGISAGRPGYREIVIRPRPGGDVTSSRATFTSGYGPVSTRWRQRSGEFVLSCAVPPNTTAEVRAGEDPDSGDPHPRDVAADGGRLHGVPGRLRRAPLHDVTGTRTCRGWEPRAGVCP